MSIRKGYVKKTADKNNCIIKNIIFGRMYRYVQVGGGTIPALKVRNNIAQGNDLQTF